MRSYFHFLVCSLVPAAACNCPNLSCVLHVVSGLCTVHATARRGRTPSISMPVGRVKQDWFLTPPSRQHVVRAGGLHHGDGPCALETARRHGERAWPAARDSMVLYFLDESFFLLYRKITGKQRTNNGTTYSTARTAPGLRALTCGLSKEASGSLKKYQIFSFVLFRQWQQCSLRRLRASVTGREAQTGNGRLQMRRSSLPAATMSDMRVHQGKDLFVSDPGLVWHPTRKQHGRGCPFYITRYYEQGRAFARTPVLSSAPRLPSS